MKLYRNLIILLMVIAALVGAFIGVQKLSSGDDLPQTTETPQTEAITIYEVDSDNIVKVGVKTADEEYSVMKNGEKWELSNGSGLRINDSKIQSLVYSCSAISASKIMSENPEDVAAYGLDEPSSVVDIYLEDGSVKTVLVGSTTLDKASGYIKLADSSAIYLKSMYGINSLTPEYKSFINTALITVDTSDLSSLTHVYISKTENTPVKLEYTNLGTESEPKRVWKMIAPVYADLNGQVLAEYVLTPLAEFSAIDVAEAHVTDRSVFGLDKPYAKFSIGYNGETIELIFGDKYDDYRFVMVKGYDTVYTLKDSDTSFLDVPYQNLMSQLIHVEYIDEVSKIEVSGPDIDITMEISENTYKINGKKIEKRAFSKAYQAVIGISLDSVDLSAVPDSAYDATIKYTKNDGNVVTVGFISVSDRNYRAVVDGKGNSITAKKNFSEATDFVMNTYKDAK